MNRVRLGTRRSAALFALLLFGSLPSLLAVEYNQLAGSVWLLNATAAIKSSYAQISGSTRGYGVLTLDADSTLTLEDSTGATISGSWRVDASHNLNVLITSADVEDFIYNGLPGNLGQYIDSLEVTQVVSKATITVNGDQGSLGLTLSFKAYFSVQGQDVTMTYALKATGSGDLSGQSLVGSQWSLTAALKYTAGKIKVANAPEAFRLVLGPAGGLAAGQFALDQGPGSQLLFSGRYFRGRSGLVFLPDNDALESYLGDLGYQNSEVVGGVDDLYVIGLTPAFSAKINGATLSFTGKCKFRGWYDVGDRSLDFSGNYQLTGTGVAE